MRFLENEKLRLRAVEPDDADKMCSIENDSCQWRENGMMAPYSRHNLKLYAENYDADPIRSGQLRMIAELRDRNEIGGIVDLYDINPTGRTAFVGIYIAEYHRGQGLGTMILELMEKYACMLLNLRSLGAKVSDKNYRSISLFEKAGYHLCGRMTKWLLSGHNEYDLLIYQKEL